MRRFFEETTWAQGGFPQFYFLFVFVILMFRTSLFSYFQGAWSWILSIEVISSFVIYLLARLKLSPPAFLAFALHFMMILTEIYLALEARSVLGTFLFWMPCLITMNALISTRFGTLVLTLTGMAGASIVIEENFAFGLQSPRHFTALEFQHFLMFDFILILTTSVVLLYLFTQYRERIEELLHSERLLRAGAERREAFIKETGVLAHDLNNPLAIIHATINRYRHEISKAAPDTQVIGVFREYLSGALERLEDVGKGLRSASIEISSQASVASGNLLGEGQTMKRDIPWNSAIGSHKLTPYLVGFGTLIVVFDGIHMLFIHANLIRFLFIPILLACFFAGYVYTKRGGNNERAVIGVIGSVTLLITIQLLIVERSVLVSALQYYCLFVSGAFLLLRRSKALRVSIFVLAQCVFFLCAKISETLGFAKDLTFSSYVSQDLLTAFIVCLTAFASAIIHVKQRDQTVKLLLSEHENRLRNARFREISSVSRSLSDLVHASLGRLRLELDELDKDGRKFDAAQLGYLHNALDEIIHISRSFHWLHQDHHAENIRSIALPTLYEQSLILLRAKAEEQGWILVLHRDIPLSIYEGRITSLVLLVLTVGHRIIDSEKASPQDGLSFRMIHENGKIIWEYSWMPGERMYHDEVAEVIDKMRMNFIDELSGICHASVQESMDRFRQVVRVEIEA